MSTNGNPRRKKRKSQSARMIMVFLSTLTGVVTIGICLILLQRWVNADVNKSADSGAYGHIKLTREAIPIDATEEETAAVMEAVVEEMQETNERYAEEIGDEEYLEANNIYVKESHNTDKVTLTFIGDILFDSNYAVMSTLKQNGGDITSGIDAQIINFMEESDIVMANNEFPYSTSGAPLEGKQFTFRAKPETVSYLDDMNVDLVSLANNHAYDYGQQAFVDTLDTLDGAGIAYVGAGHNIDEASSAVFYIINNMKIGILSATQIEKGDSPDTKGATDTNPGVFRCWNNDRLLSAISETRKECDFLVVYIHWGTESTTELDWAQTQQAPEMVNAGADLIIGDHPHVLQPISTISGVPVVYSLGNFWFNSKEIDTCMIQATVTETGLDTLRFVPCLQSGCKTRMLSGDEGMRVINEMQNMSPNIMIDTEGYISY